ncbi:MAG: tRNA pseudouridine(38-40) synthase TruA [Bacteroidia bacterium]
MKRYFIRLSYNGTAYHGWQVQENTLSTIQQVLNTMLCRLLNEDVFATGCGRTDAGVHASDFYAHFDTSVDLLADEAHWIFKFNNALPADISIKRILKVKENANARFDAVSRTYRYVVTRVKDPFGSDRSWFIYGELDLDAMNKAAKILFEYSDFSAFAKTNTQTGTNLCKLYIAEWVQEDERLIFTISADRFLRNMVRAIVGTLVLVGKKKISLERFREIIESKERSQAGFSAPARGLFLVKVEYPEDYFKCLNTKENQ